KPPPNPKCRKPIAPETSSLGYPSNSSKWLAPQAGSSNLRFTQRVHAGLGALLTRAVPAVHPVAGGEPCVGVESGLIRRDGTTRPILDMVLHCRRRSPAHDPESVLLGI